MALGIKTLSLVWEFSDDIRIFWLRWLRIVLTVGLMESTYIELAIYMGL